MDGDWMRLGAVAAASFAAGAGATYVALNGLKPKPVYHAVGTISNVLIYPIKSCRPISVEEAVCTRLGLRQDDAVDRSFLLTDSNYHFITARMENKMVLIAPSFKNGNMLLDAPGMETFELKIPKEVEGQCQPCEVWGDKTRGLDCGDDVGAWFERFLERPKNTTRLLYHPWRESMRYYQKWHYWERYRKDDQAIYSDFNGYMILGEGSLADLNSRCSEQFSYLNFRPNLTVKGAYPYEEDAWKLVKLGNDASFRCIRPCTRCIFTTINPETGIRGEQPLKMLRSYRRPPDPAMRKREGDSPVFGRHLGLDNGGIVRLGDVVQATF